MFSEERKFIHYKHDFYFEPAPDSSTAGALLGRLGRLVESDENLSPEEGLVETTHEGWKACAVVVDPTEHADGQKVSVQVDERVGKPIAILKSLVDAINNQVLDAPYRIEAEPMFDSQDFWEFVKENEGAVTSITFEFIAPNGPWNTSESIKEEMIAWREKVGAQKIIETFKSEDGLKTDSPEIKEAVEYIEKGSGNVSAKARKGRRFSSTNKPISTTIEKGNHEPTIVRVARQIAKVLGR